MRSHSEGISGLVVVVGFVVDLGFVCPLLLLELRWLMKPCCGGGGGGGGWCSKPFGDGHRISWEYHYCCSERKLRKERKRK